VQTSEGVPFKIIGPADYNDGLFATDDVLVHGGPDYTKVFRFELDKLFVVPDSGFGIGKPLSSCRVWATNYGLSDLTIALYNKTIAETPKPASASKEEAIRCQKTVPITLRQLIGNFATSHIIPAPGLDDALVHIGCRVLHVDCALWALLMMLSRCYEIIKPSTQIGVPAMLDVGVRQQGVSFAKGLKSVYGKDAAREMLKTPVFATKDVGFHHMCGLNAIYWTTNWAENSQVIKNFWDGKGYWTAPSDNEERQFYGFTKYYGPCVGTPEQWAAFVVTSHTALLTIDPGTDELLQLVTAEAKELNDRHGEAVPIYFSQDGADALREDR